MSAKQGAMAVDVVYDGYKGGQGENNVAVDGIVVLGAGEVGEAGVTVTVGKDVKEVKWSQEDGVLRLDLTGTGVQIDQGFGVAW